MSTGMKSLKRFTRPLLGIALVLAVGCQSSSPTEPKGSGTPSTPKVPLPVTTYNIAVSASPTSLAVGATTPSKVTVQVHRTDNGQAPPDLTEVTVSTTLGEFGSAGSGLKTTTVQLVNGQGQVALFPGASQGTATLKAQLDTSAGAANVQIGQQATFFVSSVDPSLGSPNGGDVVQIAGGGFVQPVRVTFGTAPAEVLSVTPNLIRVRTPTGAAAGANPQVGQAVPVNVAVTINANQPTALSDTLTNGFTYALGGGILQPQVFSISPASGTNDGGTTVTLVGDGFDQPVQVLFGHGGTAANFNGVEATVLSVSRTRLVVSTPAARGFGQGNRDSLVDILVKNLNTGFSTVAAGYYKYGSAVLITAMGPGAGSYQGGTKVTIFGQGFEAPVAVSLGGIGQLVLSVTGTEIIFQTVGVPVTACPASGVITATGVSVTNINTGASASASLSFSYIVPLPVITGISPNAGSVGTTATISGVNFSTRGIQVVFGDATNGSSASINSVSADGRSISVTVPSPPPGFVFNTQTCTLDPGPPIVSGVQNIPTPISVTVRNLDGTACQVTLSNAFLLSPPNNTCH
jgi:hypothetical protein